MVNLQANTIRHVLSTNLTSIVIPSRYLLTELLSHNLALITSVVFIQCRLIINCSKSIAALDDPLPADSNRRIIDKFFIGSNHIVRLLIACMAALGNEAKLMEIINRFSILTSPPPLKTAGLQVFFLFLLPALYASMVRNYISPILGIY